MRYTAPNKCKMRDLALKGNGIVKNAILLPSKDMFDLKQGMKHPKRFDPKTSNLILIERDLTTANQIRQFVVKSGFRHHLHQGEAHKLTRNDLLCFTRREKVELAIFDFCGQLTLELARNLNHEMRDVFANNSNVSFTFSLETRGLANRFLEVVDRNKKVLSALYDSIPKKQAQFEPQFAGYMDDPHRTLMGLTLALADNYIFEFTDICGYTANKHPMVFVKTRIKRQITGNNPLRFRNLCGF